ncbi:MAG: alcohol dehydrogenase catalytic domain-containing protein [Victivallaceae bacterium]|jgi:L-iditol 2-dehydrogenase
MKTCKLTGIRRMAMMDVPTPEIQNDTDVLIKMSCVGVCGSDVHYYESGQIGSQVVQYPFTVGHEGAGIVVAAGRAVTRVKAGSRIAIEPAMPCHQCDQCLAGRPHTCRKLRFLGCPGQAEGCLSEYLVMPEASCFPIPDSMTFDEAALSEPLAIGVYAVRQSIPLKGAKIGILGSGPIGLSVLMPALAGGAAKIYVTDKIDARLAVACRAGAAWTGNPLKEDIVQAVTAAEPLLLDAVFECAGEQDTVDQALALLKPGGKLILIGIPPTQEKYCFSVDLMRRKEICIQNIRRQNHCCQTALDMIRDRIFDVNIMRTHRFNFNDTAAAFDLVANYRDGVVKVMIDF